ncbi:hypothetical protein OQA88_2775 [Cercophora sp. LCS_1]
MASPGRDGARWFSVLDAIGVCEMGHVPKEACGHAKSDFGVLPSKKFRPTTARILLNAQARAVRMPRVPGFLMAPSVYADWGQPADRPIGPAAGPPSLEGAEARTGSGVNVVAIPDEPLYRAVDMAAPTASFSPPEPLAATPTPSLPSPPPPQASSRSPSVSQAAEPPGKSLPPAEPTPEPNLTDQP